MQIERKTYGTDPEQVVLEPFDCVWVRFSDRTAPSPLSSRSLQWVDWRLQGQLTRHLMSGEKLSSPTFLPTMKRLSTPLVALDTGVEMNWEGLRACCRGMGFKKLLFLCEEGADIARIEEGLLKEDLPGVESVILGSDSLERE